MMDFGAMERALAAQMAFQGATLKETKAARKAQESYNKKLIELQQQGLALQADQIAKNYAMQQAQLEWDKESFREEFGETQLNNKWERDFQDKQQALDEVWRTAEQSGFRDGVPTLETMQFNESTRQFDMSFGEGQRQFNVKTVMDAQRGPADWAAYTRKLRGVQESGMMPGAVGSMFDPSQQAASFSNGGQQTGHVLTNTELALGMTGQGGPGTQGTAWQGMGQGAGQGQQTTPSTPPSGASNPYSETGQPAGGGSQHVAQMLGVDTQQPMALPSVQKFRRYAPTEQEMGLGYLAENGGPTEDDAKYLMERQAPQFARSRSARYAGL